MIDYSVKSNFMAEKSKDFIQDIKKEFANIGSKVNELWDDMVRGNKIEIQVDHYQSGNQFFWELELAGVEKQNVKVQIIDENLVVSGNKIIGPESPEKKLFIHQRKAGNFETSFPLPKGADTDNIKAKMENGVLTISMNKLSATTKESDISVE